jgi:hypothetical protein
MPPRGVAGDDRRRRWMHCHAAYGARLVRRDLAATTALFVRSIDRHLAQRDLKTSCAAPVMSKEVTLSDGEGQEERAPTRRYARW